MIAEAAESTAGSQETAEAAEAAGDRRSRGKAMRKRVLGDQRRLLNLKRWWLVEPGKTAKRWYKARLRSQAKARRQGKDLEPRQDIDDLWKKCLSTRVQTTNRVKHRRHVGRNL